jgi:hypothetical protein
MDDGFSPKEVLDAVLGATFIILSDVERHTAAGRHGLARELTVLMNWDWLLGMANEVRAHLQGSPRCPLHVQLAIIDGAMAELRRLTGTTVGLEPQNIPAAPPVNASSSQPPP